MTLVAVGVNKGVATGSAPSGVKPNAVNALDCNGHSATYKSLRPSGALCTDPVSRERDGDAYRFEDNGSYVGHDEPSVRFLSSKAGSASSMVYDMQLSSDPAAAPTLTGKHVTDYGELSIAPWFGLPLCDGRSYPLNACTPHSDKNTGSGAATDAGSAVMELQFYPPKFAPFNDSVSCDQTHWCAALTVDSLECTFGFASCNNNCVEPQNFAFLQTNGVPVGPPSPQLADPSTYRPNGQTLMLNDGDQLRVAITDTPQGLKTQVTDLTSGQSGFMVASGANGFMNTDISDCNGHPFNFHAEYSSATRTHVTPWAALELGVEMEQEIGHFEACNSTTSAFPQASSGDGHSFADSKVFQVCKGGSDASDQGEGPCLLQSDGSTFCANAETEGPSACPTGDPNSGALCEFSDAPCFKKGTRTVSNDGVDERVTWPIAGCLQTSFQNGDLDFDGTSYQTDWPDGTSAHPTPFNYSGPFQSNGSSYPQVQFETDIGGSESACDTDTGDNCTAKPEGADFYPFWSLGSAAGAATNGNSCVWNFGNDIAGRTVTDFGGDNEYGAPDLSFYGGNIISQPAPNPQLTTKCPRLPLGRSGGH